MKKQLPVQAPAKTIPVLDDTTGLSSDTQPSGNQATVQRHSTSQLCQQLDKHIYLHFLISCASLTKSPFSEWPRLVKTCIFASVRTCVTDIINEGCFTKNELDAMANASYTFKNHEKDNDDVLGLEIYPRTKHRGFKAIKPTEKYRMGLEINCKTVPGQYFRIGSTGTCLGTAKTNWRRGWFREEHCYFKTTEKD